MNNVGISRHIKFTQKHTENKHETVNASFGLFAESILDQCNQAFSLMYYHVFKQYWHTSMDARMPRGYFVTNRSMGIYEVYFPTRASLGSNMQYYRIVIKVVPELSHEQVKAESKTLTIRQCQPNGIVDSELVCLIAPKRSEKARKERQFLRGYRHVKKLGYLTAIIINPVPEICMKRLLMLIATFLKRRIKKLVEKLGYEPWQYDYKKGSSFYYSYLSNVIENYSYSIAQTLRCFSHSYSWIRKQLKRTMHEIGRQTLVRVKLNQLFEVKRLYHVLNMPISHEIAVKEAELFKEAKRCYWIKEALSHSEWAKRIPHVTLKVDPREVASLFQRVVRKGEGHG